jgi:hypothetical protein
MSTNMEDGSTEYSILADWNAGMSLAAIATKYSFTNESQISALINSLGGSGAFTPNHYNGLDNT